MKRLHPDTVIMAVAFCLGMMAGMGAYVFLHQPAYLPCLPGSRGNVCELPRPASDTLPMRQQGGNEVVLDPACGSGSTSAHAIAPDSACVAELDANTIAVPTAQAVPSMVVLTDAVWLRATSFPPADALTLTLTAPDGTSCAIPPDQITPFGAGVQAFATPASCEAIEGNWTATFSTATGAAAVARFYAVGL